MHFSIKAIGARVIREGITKAKFLLIMLEHQIANFHHPAAQSVAICSLFSQVTKDVRMINRQEGCVLQGALFLKTVSTNSLTDAIQTSIISQNNTNNNIVGPSHSSGIPLSNFKSNYFNLTFINPG